MFSLVISTNTHPVKYTSVSNYLPHPPCITTKAKSNGACLFNSFSLLMYGRDTYSAIIRHVICNYIDNPVKQILLNAYIPDGFCTGKQYTKSRNMCHFSTWGTELDIIALSVTKHFIWVTKVDFTLIQFLKAVSNNKPYKLKLSINKSKPLWKL